MSPEAAEIIALRVLGWVVADEELCPMFLGSTGSNQDEIRERAGEAEFQASVLSFLTMDDAWVVRCCDELGLAYTDPLTAKQMLPGGADVSWT